MVVEYLVVKRKNRKVIYNNMKRKNKRFNDTICTKNANQFDKTF